MRPGRVAVLAALPVLALLGVQHGGPSLPSPASPGSAGQGSVALTALVRVVADGRPQPVTLAATPVPAASPALPAALPPAVHIAPRSQQVRAAVVAPAPAAVRVAKRSTTTDGYPYRTDTSGGVDAWGFTKRQCVSYVAWRLAEAGRPIDNSDGWGSALDWDEAARGLGYTVTSRPAVGSVAQWDAGERTAYWSPGASASDGSYVAGPMGHVAWVTEVYGDGSVLVAQYNGSGDRTFSTMRVRAPRYLRLG